MFLNISEVASVASEAAAQCETFTANNVCVRESTLCECNDAIPVYSDSYYFDSRPHAHWLTAAGNDPLTALAQAVRQLGYLLCKLDSISSMTQMEFGEYQYQNSDLGELDEWGFWTTELH
mmetsp:Transcript_91778/g.182330  ORF Transcript_91778/g.182330 Transcript_91778/m.182330 type:complete len:120 (+) Transcript_91778:671-1030(+)